MSTANGAAKSIGDASRETGLSIDTLRYYERCGLICRVQRDSGGRRRYTDLDIAWFGFLRRLRATGLSVRAMRKFARLQQQGRQTLEERLHILQSHREGLASRIGELSQMLAYIDEKIDDYEQALRADRDRRGE